MTSRFHFEPSPAMRGNRTVAELYRAVDAFLRGEPYLSAETGYSSVFVATVGSGPMPLVLRDGWRDVAVMIDTPPCVDVMFHGFGWDGTVRRTIMHCLGFDRDPGLAGGKHEAWRSPPLLLPAWRAWRSGQ